MDNEQAASTAEVAPLNIVVEDFDGVNLVVRFNRPLNGSNSHERRRSYELRDMPQCTYNGTRDVFVFPLTAASAEFIVKSWPDTVWESEDARRAFDLVLALEKAVERRADIIGRYIHAAQNTPKGEPLPPNSVPTIAGHVFKRKPMAHQVVALECCRTSPFLGLFMEMGTGKTKTISDLLDYAAQRFEKERPLRVLIVCPKSVLVNWVRELASDVSAPYRVAMLSGVGRSMSQELRELNLVSAKGGEFGSMESLLELIRCQDVKLQVAIINYDSIKGRLDLLKSVKFDFCILDESHKIKAMGAKRTKAVLDLAMTCGRRYVLTGTPLTQNPMDLYAQFEFLGPGMGLLGYTSYYAYQNAYSEKSSWGRTSKWKDTGKLLTHASKWSFSVKKKDCLDLPPKVYERRVIEMTDEQRSIYEQVATEVLLVLESLGAEVTIQNILVQYLRLAQVTSGYLKTSDGREVPIKGGEVKIDELMDIIEETNGAKIVVWSRFIHEIESVCARLEKAGVKHVKYYGGVKQDDRQIAIDSFQNDPETKVFVGNAQAGGIGINLTSASLVVYISNDFSLANRLQSEDRTHRVGQHNSVTYIDLTCEDTIDELVLKRLNDKREMAEFFTNPEEMVSSLKEFLANTIRR
jgi:superfamily II DNA or RNA helicase